MQDKNNNNPFQVDQSPAQPDNNNVEVTPTFPVAETPIAPAKQRPVALDGVSPSYDNYDNGAENQSEPFVPMPESAPAMDSAYSQPQEATETDQIGNDTSTDNQGYINPLVNATQNTTPSSTVPELDNPDATAIEINKVNNGLTFKAWQFFITLGIAIIGVAGTIFFVVEYSQTNASFEETLVQLETYRNQAETSQKAAQQLGDLQDTVREQAEKITTLKEENDTLKKSADELKTVKEENTKLKQEKEDLVNSLAKLAP